MASPDSGMGGRERTAMKQAEKERFKKPWDSICDLEALSQASLRCMTTPGNTKEDCRKQVDEYRACLHKIRDAKNEERNKIFFADAPKWPWGKKADE
mmetsp:Transcript_6726/g.13282  ORF Transcript_6726/g.13282 Transcript_6726/m.13282 type:complete len:97 (+) Transcript_6726:27-317(+)|eukprot:CAMPEP_0181297056 /NCGR_PEP_ID=MMETSP1101-20121128/5034_1 /TAXON_ID=46948 /ORGANISM="Rhodomonas abbreviata, Strain Caron Lab Isolate" /LENGTH=96 /DNA_ID=CAMNT_0023401963 /DNA_START=27 /DNA_END=317 /DNA_ORIENTATION=-